MNSFALFGLSILMSFLAFTIITKVYIWPQLRVMHRTDALIPLVIPHIFRFAGLSFLIPGVVSPALSPTFAIPAAYGDLVAAMSAFVLEDGVVYHTYSAYSRGLDALWGMYPWLDRAPRGRNESGIWWRRHDEYDKR